MWTSPQETEDLIIYTNEALQGRLYFFEVCAVIE